jgi:uncharacterized protein
MLEGRAHTPMPEPVLAAPIATSDRIEAIDVLRGVALSGVLSINLVTEFRVSIFTQFLPRGDPLPPLDQVVDVFLTQAVQSKAIALFSLLFGIGLAMQFDRLAAHSQRAILLVRRLVVLLAIGLVHMFLIWNGDILAHYALAGLVVLPFLFGSLSVLAIGTVVFLGLFFLMPVLNLMPFPETGWMQQHVVAANRAYGTGGFAEVLAFRIDEVPALLPFHLQLFPLTVTLFLLGALTWRLHVLQRASPTQLSTLGGITVGVIGGIALLVALTGVTVSQWPLWNLVKRVVPDILALGYAAIIIAIAQLPRTRSLLAWAAPVGRMAFTNYLAQSVILGFVFYGYGLGLFGRLGVAAAFAIAIVLYAAQAWFSAWWLERFRFGPVEWLWRTLMYGVKQPMRRIVTAATA